MRSPVVVVVLLLGSSTARAEEPERSSTTVATLLTFAGTTASIPLALAAIATDSAGASKTYGILAASTALIGPSLGRWYAHDPAWGGLLMRGIGVGLFAAVANATWDDSPPAFVLAPGIVLLAVGTIYDVAETPRSIAERNRPVRVMPTVLVTPGNTAAPGLAIGGRF